MSSFTDRLTGAPILQVTNHPSINHPTYFLQSSFLADGSGMVFTSYRTGTAQLFKASLKTGELLQLTDGQAIHPFSPAISGNGIYFVRGGSVWRIDLASLEEKEIAHFDNAQLGECSLSADGNWLTAAIKQGTQAGVVTGRTDGSGWILIPFERTVIHPQFHPLEPDWLIFAGDPAPRMFRVRRDGSGMECLHQHGNDEFIVHETFLGHTGDIVFTIWPRLLCRMDWTTRNIREIAQFNAWHIASNVTGTKVLCDTNHPDRGIFLIDAASGVPHPVCASDSSNGGSQWRESRYALAADFARARSAAKEGATLSWMEASTDTVYGPQWTHPHPSFSQDETRIAFASDRTGTTQVYVAGIELQS
jgi:oligogalacturonide lyase